jgi:hypothetical protein
MSLPNKELCDSNNISYSKILMKNLRGKNPVQTNGYIASAITSYARIHMMQFKTIPNNELLYTDTDSVFLTRPLDPQYIDATLLGLFKLEWCYYR